MIEITYIKKFYFRLLEKMSCKTKSDLAGARAQVKEMRAILAQEKKDKLKGLDAEYRKLSAGVREAHKNAAKRELKKLRDDISAEKKSVTKYAREMNKDVTVRFKECAAGVREEKKNRPKAPRGPRRPSKKKAAAMAIVPYVGPKA